MNSISEKFYADLWSTATGINQDVRSKYVASETLADEVTTIIQNRLSTGLSNADTAKLLLAVMDPASTKVHAMILAAATNLRSKLFDNKVSIMVPVEISSYCSSNCLFCGWRKDNNEIPRLRVSLAGLARQVEYLLSFNFSHIELAGGDDLNLLRDHLGDYINEVRVTAHKLNKNPNISICLSPLNERQYSELAAKGLDAVLTWQETYDPSTFNKYISSSPSPKGNGLDDNFKVIKNGDGHLTRMMSQEAAVRAGLQVGIGCMIGLHSDVASDILSVILHGKALMETYAGVIKPVIIGMPIWNKITTGTTDLAFLKESGFDVAKYFDLIAAIYLLAFPDYAAWVFPNCRVEQGMQIKAVKAAGCFTSTMVRLGPGAYLNADYDIAAMFDKSSIPVNDLTYDKILLGEQFTHFYEEHTSYLNAFTAAGIQIVDERQLIEISAAAAGK